LIGYFYKYLNRIKIFIKYKIIIPKNSSINNISNIEIGGNFGISSYCQILAQGKIGESKLIIGSDVYLNYNVLIIADHGEIVIGNNVLIGPNSVLRSSGHKFERTDIPISKQGHLTGMITIGNDVWLGSNVVILPNVTIGDSTVIGAGSVVTKDIPPFSIAVGNPAKVIKQR